MTDKFDTEAEELIKSWPMNRPSAQMIMPPQLIPAVGTISPPKPLFFQKSIPYIDTETKKVFYGSLMLEHMLGLVHNPTKTTLKKYIETCDDEEACLLKLRYGDEL